MSMGASARATTAPQPGGVEHRVPSGESHRRAQTCRRLAMLEGFASVLVDAAMRLTRRRMSPVRWISRELPDVAVDDVRDVRLEEAAATAGVAAARRLGVTAAQGPAPRSRRAEDRMEGPRLPCRLGIRRR